MNFDYIFFVIIFVLLIGAGYNVIMWCHYKKKEIDEEYEKERQRNSGDSPY
jgi:hypothetical protein